ncbi:hypothetical protein HKD37_06G015700 [Glycine soja]
MGCVIGVRLASFFTGAAAASFLGLYSLHNDYKLAHLYYIQRREPLIERISRCNGYSNAVLWLFFKSYSTDPELQNVGKVRRQNLEGRDFGWPSCYSSSPFLTSELYKGLKSFPLPTKQNVNVIPCILAIISSLHYFLAPERNEWPESVLFEILKTDEWPPQITGKSNFFLGKTETNGNF